jgi:hypothetical protein
MPSTHYEFRLDAVNSYGEQKSNPREFTTAPPVPPTVTPGTASQIKRVSATLSATVNPNEGTVVGCTLEWGETTSYGKSIPCSSKVGSGDTPVPVSAAISELAPGTEYHFRVSAVNVGVTGPGEGEEATFVTLPEIPPTAETLPASEVAYRVATLNGSVNPNEVPVTECEFEYGTSLAFPTPVPCTPTPEAQATPVAVKAELHSLSANTTYQYRVGATNLAGTGFGSVQAFSTLQRPEVEVGRCVKLARGNYSDAGCTEPEDGGAFEWLPLQKGNFRFQNGATVFETGKSVAIRCSGNALSGEYAGPHTASVSLAFAGCEATSGLSGKCQSEGAQTGEIEAAPVTAELVLIEATKKVTAGWDFKPTTGSTLMTFRCGAAQVTVQGAVIATLAAGKRGGSPIGTMRVSFTLKLVGKKGKQKPEEIEKGSPETLTFLIGSSVERASLKLSGLMVNEELLEIRKNG